MARRKLPSVCPQAGDGGSKRKGRRRSSRNTESDVLCDGQDNVPRYVQLSKHKRLDKRFQPNRGKKSRRNKESIVYAEVPRFIYLSEPKKLPEDYLINRLSPIWPVKRQAMRAQPSSRIRELAKPKQLHKDWQPSKSVYSTTPMGDEMMYDIVSSRTEELAKHKTYYEPPTRKSYLWDYPFWDHQISEEAKTISPTERIVELAKPKGDYAGYVPSRLVDEPVSDAAMSYLATERIGELAKPKIRAVATKSENPFEISEFAKNAVATPRLEQLALPLPRKVTRKKL
ncbi:sperm microtubule associated protein 2 isoform X2 [Stegostoma tigrinum]|uniref:sperm microtubule associated protein 2 isoform X2 n=1 Tax=Stegostoma tigrinum TaxID=3053191 RepID=UPI00202B5C96|nr:sperm microtubule associated protein 2 isoform X2 [Stegostoma tigrinum]